MKILVVDDNRTNLLIVTKYVERLGHTPLQAQNGEQALEKFRDNQPDIVLLDIMMPDIDGFEVARRIRSMEEPSDWTPIIFLSAMSADQDIEQGIAAGGDDYLTKPVSEVIFGAKVRAMQRIVQMRCSLLALTHKLDAANQELRRISASDGLTGIANRRFFDEYIAREWRRARRNSSQLALMMCDVDLFKHYNDHYGHQAGDDCLRQIARMLTGTLERASDIVARYGGEEFSVIMPDTPIGGALVVAEKIRHATHTLNLPHAGAPAARVTLSIGIATFAPTSDDNAPHDLIEHADRALYRAKHEGRDRVCRFDAQLDG